MSRGISSNGRAPALHAGSTGIDTRILHVAIETVINFINRFWTTYQFEMVQPFFLSI